jgi:DUF1009 family protein
MPISEKTEMPVGILAAGGTLPFAIAAALLARGQEVVVFGFEGLCDPEAITRHRHHWVGIGQAGRLFRLLQAERVRDIVMIGTMIRPAIRDVRLDWTSISLLPQLIGALRGGDDHLLVRIGRIFENRGFRLVGLHDLVPEILMPTGHLTRAAPDADALTDVAVGQDVLRALSPFDIGQAVVVVDRHVIGVEGIEGTDALLSRVAQLRAEGRIRKKAGRGVLVKAPKAGQDLRFDLPTVGPRTIDGIVSAALGGLAVTEGRAIAVEPQAMIERADRAGVFLVGMAP